MTMKTCTKCKRTQPLSAFVKMTASRDGLACWCRACRTEYNRGWRDRNRQWYAYYQRRYYKAHRGRKEKLGES